MISLTEDEFALVYDALRRANTEYTIEEVPSLVAAEGKAWTAVQAVAARGKADQPA